MQKYLLMSYMYAHIHAYILAKKYFLRSKHRTRIKKYIHLYPFCPFICVHAYTHAHEDQATANTANQYLYIHTRIHTHVHVCMYMDARTHHSCMRAYTHKNGPATTKQVHFPLSKIHTHHTHIPIYIYTYIHTSTHIYMHTHRMDQLQSESISLLDHFSCLPDPYTYTHTDIHTYTNTHAYIYTYLHTHIHTEWTSYKASPFPSWTTFPPSQIHFLKILDLVDAEERPPTQRVVLVGSPQTIPEIEHHQIPREIVAALTRKMQNLVGRVSKEVLTHMLTAARILLFAGNLKVWRENFQMIWMGMRNWCKKRCR